MIFNIAKKVIKSKYLKLSMLGISVISLLVSSGYSFAKYYEEEVNEKDAGSAKFDGGTIYYDYETIQTPEGELSTLGIYAFIATFRIDFTNIEVKSNYTLKLQLSSISNSSWKENPEGLEHTSFILLELEKNENDVYEHPVYTFVSEKVDNSESSNVSISNDPLSLWKLKREDNSIINEFHHNTFYYGKGQIDYNTNTNQVSSYIWYEKTLTEQSNVTLVEDSTIDLNTKTDFFKIIYFVNINLSEGEAVKALNSRILYNLDIYQIN